MAGIKQVIQDILTQVGTATVTNGDGTTVNLPARIWNNQLKYDKEGKLYPIPKPHAFVEVISPVGYTQLGGNFLQADLGINIHLVTECMDAGDGTFEQDMTIFDLRDQIIAILSQFEPTACGKMFAVSETQDTDHDNLYHYIVSFVCCFIDSKASPYDPSRGNYIDSTPPTGLTINSDIDNADGPVYTSQGQFKIP